MTVSKKTKAEKEAEKAHAIEALKNYCPAGTRVYCILRRVSSSGMTRAITLAVAAIDNNGKNCIVNLDYFVARALDRKVASNGGVSIGGCGMDMGFALVHELSVTLYGESYNLSHEWL